MANAMLMGMNPVVSPPEDAPPRPAPRRALWRHSSEPVSAHRVAGLSDGVFAFVITLLVLDLKLPDIAGSLTRAARHRAFLADLSGLAYPMLWYVITGLIVGGYWSYHARLTRSTETFDDLLVRQNIWLLIGVALLPFATSLISAHGSEPLAVICYAGVHILINSLQLLMLRRQQLLGRERQALEPLLVRSLGSITTFLLVAAVSVYAPLDSWLLLTLLYPFRMLWAFWLARRA